MVNIMNVPSYFSKCRGLCFKLFAGAALIVGLSGCLENYGRFSRDAQVSHAFRSGLVPQELNYFYAGKETNPYAIMGIDPGYVFPSTFWTAFEPQPAELRCVYAGGWRW